ncbi:MAG: tRNA pseudouridine(55) synthase TruB [Bacteroidales bacterium]|nr:tRNA pseudouridine(55) synthase TruB [Bacteroidales bacterium]
MIDLEKGGVILINKPYEWTSFQAVNKIKVRLKHYFNTKKVKIGHAGTLDPLATGLLIVCVGKFTKKIEEYQAQEKEYTGTFYLGATTPSYDKEKEIDKYYPIDHITQDDIYKAAEAFLGEQEQVPPMFSALKVNGVRAYEFARDNKEIELKSRKITIKEFEITRIALPEVDFRIVCSKGTYIRSIARDFGFYLNSGAYLTALCRTRIGEYTLNQAQTIEDIISEYENKE